MSKLPKDFIDSLRYLEIKTVVMSNFKIPGEIKLELNDYTEIIGDNGTGKTTLMDAIAFCLKGKDASGKKIDFITDGKDAAFVKLLFTNGVNSWVLERNLTRNATGKISAVISLDLQKVKESELKEIFDEDLCLSIINPSYFTRLSPTKGRNLLASGMDVDFNKAVLVNRSSIARSKREIEIFKQTFKEIKNIEDVLSVESKSKIALRKLDRKVYDLSYEVDVLRGVLIEEFSKVESIKEEIAAMKLDESTKDIVSSIINSTFAQVDREVEISSKESELKHARIDSAIKRKELEFLKEFYKKFLIEIQNKTNEILTNTTVQLIDFVERVDKETKEVTIEEKEVFKVYFNNKEINNCSMSEQVRANIEIADALANQTGLCLPTFIDNAESIGAFEMPTFLSQLISLTFHNKAKLSVIEGDEAIALETKETMPKPDPKKEPIRRVLADFF